MNTDIYKISNSKIICRVLPFFARGRRMILFLEAVSTPLIRLHKKFLVWAYDMILRLKMTFQTAIIIWYLNHKFSDYFVNKSDSFEISQDAELDYLVAFNMNEAAVMEIFGTRVLNISESESLSVLAKPVKPMSLRVLANQITISAPEIAIGTDKVPSGYTNKDYLSDIKAVLDEYKTSFVKYSIVINN